MSNKQLKIGQKKSAHNENRQGIVSGLRTNLK
jgi:hypothetical protein